MESVPSGRDRAAHQTKEIAMNASQKIEMVESDAHPLCPHCAKKLTEIHWHKVRGVSMTAIGYLVVHSCPHCRKVLSTTASGR